MSQRVISIHQPQFVPYMGFFNKVVQSDVYVVLDDVKATGQDFTNRNKVKTTNGEYMMTIPVKGSKNVLINEMTISNHYDWANKHIKTIQASYGGTDHFDSYFNKIKEIYQLKDWELIMNIDLEFLEWIFDVLEIELEIIYSSNLDVDTSGTERLVQICNELDADVYISGVGAKDYLEEDLFKEKNIELKFQKFEHPEYQQKFEDFIPNLSILDPLFNCGKEEVKKMISKDRVI